MKPYRIRCLDVTGSTNDDARLAAEAGEAEGLVIQALKQTAGRGRHGRKWESLEGNLHCSVLLRPPGKPGDFGLYTFVAALAVSDTVKKYLPHVAVTLKWPNDTLADGKKISGILLESGEGWLVAGIGINVRYCPQNALYPTACFHNSGAATEDLNVILETLMDRLWYWRGVLQESGFAPIRTVWLENAKKGPMTVKLPQETLEGEFADISEDGHLRLRLADGTERAIATGDVFFG